MALMSVTPGTRMLGGLSAPSTGIAEQFQAGVQANLGRQETRQAMRLREAEDKRREAEAQRAQAAFEAQQAARAAAQAQRAAQQRAFAEYTQSLREAPATPAAGVRRPVDNFVTPTAENPFPLVPTRTGVTPPFGVPLNVEPPAGVRVGAPRGRNRVESPVQGPPVPPELQAGLERAAQDPALTPEQRRAAAIQKQTLDAAAAVGGATVDMVTDAAALLQTLGTGLIEYGVGVPLSVVSPELGARVFDQTADWYRTADQLARMGEPLTPPGSAPTAVPAGAAPAEPGLARKRTGKDPFITEQETEAGPIAGLTPAGQRDPVSATEAAVRAAPDRDASKYFMSNPNLVLDLQTQMARERQMLEARLRYAESTQNMALYDQTFAALNSPERVVNENMISGQIALLAAQQDNFGPLQEFLNRAYPNDNVEVIPYTDGTVSFFVNGREDGPPVPVADLFDGLARTFNTEYRDALTKAIEQQTEREQFLFENALLEELKTRREISVAQAKALAEIEAEYGKVDPVGDLPSGDKLFQVNVPGQGYVQFRVVEAGQPLVNGRPAEQATIEVVTQGSPLR